MPSVLFFTCDNMLATSLSFPKEMLVAASQIARAMHIDTEPLVCKMASLSHVGSSSLSGFDLKPDIKIEDIEQADLVIIPAIWRSPIKTLQLDNLAKNLILKLYQQGSIFAATGTGSWILAELGLLDNKAATTHWYHLNRFKLRYPMLNVRNQHLITQADRLYCASSINSLVDLTIHLIALLYNADIAKAVEQQFSPEVRTNYRSRVFIDGADNQHNDELVADAQQFIRDNYATKINFKHLASQLNISQRSLNRRFIEASGITPSVYLQRIRNVNARDLLKHSNLSIAEIANMVGFNTSSQFCEQFKKTNGMSPRIFKTSVKPKMFNA